MIIRWGEIPTREDSEACFAEYNHQLRSEAEWLCKNGPALAGALVRPGTDSTAAAGVLLILHCIGEAGCGPSAVRPEWENIKIALQLALIQLRNGNPTTPAVRPDGGEGDSKEAPDQATGNTGSTPATKPDQGGGNGAFHADRLGPTRTTKGDFMPSSPAETLKALENLYGLYCEARRMFTGRRCLVQSSDKVEADIRRDAVRAAILPREIDDAKTRLFATGYDVPPAWVDVEPVGKVITKRTVDAPGVIAVRFTSPGRRAVDRVLRSMRNAILKLRATTPVPYVSPDDARGRIEWESFVDKFAEMNPGVAPKQVLAAKKRRLANANPQTPAAEPEQSEAKAGAGSTPTAATPETGDAGDNLVSARAREIAEKIQQLPDKVLASFAASDPQERVSRLQGVANEILVEALPVITWLEHHRYPMMVEMVKRRLFHVANEAQACAAMEIREYAGGKISPPADRPSPGQERTAVLIVATRLIADQWRQCADEIRAEDARRVASTGPGGDPSKPMAEPVAGGEKEGERPETLAALLGGRPDGTKVGIMADSSLAAEIRVLADDIRVLPEAMKPFEKAIGSGRVYEAEVAHQAGAKFYKARQLGALSDWPKLRALIDRQEQAGRNGKEDWESGVWDEATSGMFSLTPDLRGKGLKAWVEGCGPIADFLLAEADKTRKGEAKPGASPTPPAHPKRKANNNTLPNEFPFPPPFGPRPVPDSLTTLPEDDGLRWKATQGWKAIDSLIQAIQGWADWLYALDSKKRPAHSARPLEITDSVKKALALLCNDLKVIGPERATEIFEKYPEAPADEFERMTYVGVMRSDAALYDPIVPKQSKSKRGRKPGKGPRLPNPKEAVKKADGNRCGKGPWTWQTVKATAYGVTRTLQVVSFQALWPEVRGLLPILVLLVRDPQGKFEDKYLFTTDVHAELSWVISTFSRRWSIEVAFKASKQVMKIQAPQHWCQQSIEKLSPWVWLMQSVISLGRDFDCTY